MNDISRRRSAPWLLVIAGAVPAASACGQGAGTATPHGTITGGGNSGASPTANASGGTAGSNSSPPDGVIAGGGGVGGTSGASGVMGGSGGSATGGVTGANCPARPVVNEAPTGAVDVQVTVDWNDVKRTIGPMAYGLNGFNSFDPTQTPDPAYLANLAHMRPGIFRLHNMAVMDDSAGPGVGWINVADQAWDAAKIAGAVKPLADQGLNIVINIPHWPDWMDTNDDLMLDADKVDTYAAFMAELVRIVNVQNGFKVKYWEVTNELEYRYNLIDEPQKMAQVTDLYNRACKAMKAVDPTILTGGPAISRADLRDLLTRFVSGTATEANPTTLDFFTFHSYGGDGTNTDAEAYTAATAWIEGYASSIADVLAEQSPARKIPIWYDEFAVTYAWDSKDHRTTNNKGSVWDALAITTALDHGVEWTSSWNEKDSFYGKMDYFNKLRPTGELYYMMNGWLIGERAATTSSTPDEIVTFATASGERRGLLLINRTDVLRTAGIGMQGWTPPAELGLYRIDAGGFSAVTTSWANTASGLALPPHSVTLLAAGDAPCP